MKKSELPLLLWRFVGEGDGRALDLVTMRALVEEASQSGAQRALSSLGLDDKQARRDMSKISGAITCSVRVM